MVIAVDTRFLLSAYLEGYGYCIREWCSRLAAQHPAHEFVLIFDRDYDQQFITAPNIRAVVTGPPARHPVLWKWWYDYKIPAVLKKYQATVFVGTGGFCSLRTRVPQVLVVHDLAFLHYPQGLPGLYRGFYKKYTPRFVKKAAAVFTISEFSKKDIVERYATAGEKITVAWNGIRDDMQPLTFEEKEAVKQQYTGGLEYFIYTGSIHPRKNLTHLLKAFSIFKKWQHSNMKLLLCGRLAWQYEAFVKSLETYKYRHDVQLTGYLPGAEQARLLAAAYALVYPSHFEGFGLPIAEAMQCGTPVITSNTSAMPEVGGDAALYAGPDDIEGIAAQMMRLYKDEELRSQLRQKGLERAARFNWQQSANALWSCIEKAAGK
jgi:glycosyltransferase involved in cell wall biosynthesis